MKRSTPLTRKTPMKRGKPPKRREPLVSVPPRPKPAWAGGEDPEAWAAWEAIRQQAHDRAGGLCEAGITDQCRERGRDFTRLGGHQGHHRQLRSRGGPDTIENVVAVCGYCHKWVHEHPRKATELGLMVRSGADPAAQRVTLATAEVVILTRDGGYWPCPPVRRRAS
jgi:hypothetical protein